MSHRITVAEELRTDADLIAIRAAASHVVSVVDPVTTTLTGTLTTGHLTAVDCTAGPATYTLPSAASAGKGGVVVVKKNDTTVNTIAIQRAGSDVIQGTGAGSTSRSVTLAGEAVTLVSNGTNSWSVTSSDVPIGQLDSRYNGTYGPGSDQWLKQCGAAFSFAFTSITSTDAGTGLPTAANIKWPDGTAGAFTATIDGGGNGYSGYAATWAGTTTRTLTASGISYDSSGNPLGPTGLVVA